MALPSCNPSYWYMVEFVITDLVSFSRLTHQPALVYLCRLYIYLYIMRSRLLQAIIIFFYWLFFWKWQIVFQP